MPVPDATVAQRAREEAERTLAGRTEAAEVAEASAQPRVLRGLRKNITRKS